MPSSTLLAFPHTTTPLIHLHLHTTTSLWVLSTLLLARGLAWRRVRWSLACRNSAHHPTQRDTLKELVYKKNRKRWSRSMVTVSQIVWLVRLTLIWLLHVISCQGLEAGFLPTGYLLGSSSLVVHLLRRRFTPMPPGKTPWDGLGLKFEAPQCGRGPSKLPVWSNWAHLPRKLFQNASSGSLCTRSDAAG